ncbi:MAG TPA: nicotinamide-nucleotide amidohydrolase family protein [Steroidobacteraceae bacterium]|jgi:nicotinamide-nucleotide amidase|nr:nicotinamide-nucleotide amidohydrolase family protein [Steroidobacteraceae bacterium]
MPGILHIPRADRTRNLAADAFDGRRLSWYPNRAERAAQESRITMAATDKVLFGLALRVGRRLLRQGSRVTTAESCTGGWIAKALTDVPGSSQWFGEGFVTYGNEAKVRRLGVSRTALSSDGAVSRAVVIAMAEGALRRAGADLSVAVTGIAGPDGAVPGKPVGTVWFCWAHRRDGRVRVTATRKNFRGDREAVRRKTVEMALRGLLHPL